MAAVLVSPLLGGGAAAQEAETASRLLVVEVIDTPSASALHLEFDRTPAAVTTRVLEDPPRMVVHLPRTLDRTGTPAIEVQGRRIERLRIQPRADGLDIVVETVPTSLQFAGRGVTPTDQGLLVTVVAVEGGADLDEILAAYEARRMQRGLRAEGVLFRVDEFVLGYGQQAEGLPPLGEVRQLQVELGYGPGGWVAPREGVETRTLDLSAPPSDRRFYSSAIRVVLEALVAEYQRRGLASIYVQVHEDDADLPSGRDLRVGAGGPLRIVVWLGRLLEFRTFASGPRFPEDAERINRPEHARILERSPLQAGDLFFKRELDEYAARLNRHPGRNVDWTVSESSTELGGLYLDYLVAESRPLRAYAQTSNTGTRETARWRQRFGAMMTQLTNHDDILRLDYITGNFDEVHAVVGSYDAPLYGLDRWRGTVGGSWGRFDASELGSDAEFSSDQWEVSGQVLANVWQRGDIFVDAFAGLRYQQVETDRLISPPKESGRSAFFLPEVGLRAERVRPELTLRGLVSAEFNVSGVAGTDIDDLEELGGRFGLSEEDFKILRWNVAASIFLEPLLNPQGYRDKTSVMASALAHELFVSTRGQTSFGDRLVPQYEQIAGGLHSVRGYEEAVVAGDTVVLGRAEYRFHLPRILPVQPVPLRVPLVEQFHWRPAQPGAKPDWDLVVRGFVDVAEVIIHEKEPLEEDDTLVGVGAGVELRVLDFLTTSLDWGYALTDAREGLPGEYRAGESEFHFTVTLVY